VDPLLGLLSCLFLPAGSAVFVSQFEIILLTSSFVSADGGHCDAVPSGVTCSLRQCSYSRQLPRHDPLSLVPCSVLSFLDSLTSAVSHAGISRVYPAVCSLLLVEHFPTNNLNHMSFHSRSKHPFLGRLYGPTYLRLLVRYQFFPYSPSLYGRVFVHFGTR
jgi:hypothetical protein